MRKRKKRKILLLLPMASICMVAFLLFFFRKGNLYRNETYAGTYTHSATVDGITWYYTLAGGKATNVYTTTAATEEGTLKVPEMINSYPVISVGGGTKDTPVAPNGWKEILLPDSALAINDYACYGLTSLTNFGGYSSEGKSMIYLDANRASVGAYAFKGCTGITDINLYYFTGSIGEEAFSGCTGITSLYIPKVQALGTMAFSNCTGVEDLEIHYPYISDQFQDMPLLKNIVVGEEVEKIDGKAFFINLSAYMIKNWLDNSAGFMGTTSSVANKRTFSYSGGDIKYGTSTTFNELESVKKNKRFTYSSTQGEERNWYFKNPNTTILSLITTEEPKILPKLTISHYNGSGTGTYQYAYYGYQKTIYAASIFSPTIEVYIPTYKMMLPNNYDETSFITKSKEEYIGSIGQEIITEVDTYNDDNTYRFLSGSFKEYKNTATGYAKNKIFVEVGKENTGSKTDNCTYSSTYYKTIEYEISSNPENVQSMLEGSFFENVKSMIEIYDINTVTVPSYAPEEALTGEITANYASKLAYANSKLDLSKVNVNLLYNVPNKQDVLKANQPGIYILPEAEAESMELSTDTMQNFFYEDGMRQLSGVNDITLNPLPEGEESSITNLKVYYFNGEFKHVGDASGDYDYDSEGVLKKTTQLGLQEGRYDADGNYVGLGGCYDYNEASGEYTYNVFGSYIPEIATTTFSVEAFQAEVSGIYAELDTGYIESLLMEGYDSDKEAFNLGTTITREMFKVYESYQDGTVTPNRIPADDYSISPNTVSGVGLNDITIKQISTGYETIAYVKGFSKAADSAMEDLGVAPGDYEGLAEKITDIKDQIAEKTEQLNQYEDTMNAIQSSLGTTEDTSTEEGLAAVEQKVAAVMTEITTLETKLTAVGEALASFGTVPGTGEGGTITAEDITGMITEVKAELDASKAKADSLSKFGEDIRSKLGLSSSATDTEVMSKINELLEEVKNGTASNSELETQLNTLKNQIYSLQNEKELLNNQNTNYKNQVSTLTAAKESAENAKVELEKKVLKLENENTSIRSEAKESEVEKTAVESKLSVAETENVFLQAENTSLKSQLATVKKEVAETSSQISSYQQEAKNSAQKTELLLQNKENLEKQVAELQDKVDSTVPEQSKSEEVVEPAEENLTDIQYAEAGNNQPSLEVSEEITGGTILDPEEAITSTESEMDMGILGKALALGTTIIGGSGGAGVLLFKRKKRF